MRVAIRVGVVKRRSLHSNVQRSKSLWGGKRDRSPAGGQEPEPPPPPAFGCTRVHVFTRRLNTDVLGRLCTNTGSENHPRHACFIASTLVEDPPELPPR